MTAWQISSGPMFWRKTRVEMFTNEMLCDLQEGKGHVYRKRFACVRKRMQVCMCGFVWMFVSVCLHFTCGLALSLQHLVLKHAVVHWWMCVCVCVLCSQRTIEQLEAKHSDVRKELVTVKEALSQLTLEKEVLEDEKGSLAQALSKVPHTYTHVHSYVNMHSE